MHPQRPTTRPSSTAINDSTWHHPLPAVRRLDLGDLKRANQAIREISRRAAGQNPRAVAAPEADAAFTVRQPRSDAISLILVFSVDYRAHSAPDPETSSSSRSPATPRTVPPASNWLRRRTTARTSP